MIVIEMDFPGGKFHANPWGRHVNEGIAEWPPSPFRLARALIDVYHRRRPDWSAERLTAVLSIISSEPIYYLPPATTTHTRSYLNSNMKDSGKKQKILDAFVVVEREAPLKMGFRGSFCPELIADLNELLRELNYLGRSESWIRAAVKEQNHMPEANCVPWALDGGTFSSGNEGGPQELRACPRGGGESQRIKVACLRPEHEYERLPYKPALRGPGGRTLSWLEALSLSTADLLDQGWSEPPGMKMIPYCLPAGAMIPQPPVRSSFNLAGRFCCARYALTSPVLPLVTDTVPVAERIRSHLMGIHRKISGDDPGLVSPLFSGKAPDGQPASGHQHAYYFPLDEDGDGRIDHLQIQAGRPFDQSEIKALDKLRSIWQPGGRPDINLVLVSLSAEPDCCWSSTWVSATPVTFNRHYRKGRGLYEEWLTSELFRECRRQGFPEPSHIYFTPGVELHGHLWRWLEFVRCRKGQRPLPGFGFEIIFPESVPGPFALGALAHYGLGRFQPWID